MTTAATLKSTFNEKARALEALLEQRRKLALPAAGGDAGATVELAKVNTAIVNTTGEKDTLAIAIAEAERHEREAALDADRAALAERHARASELGDQIIEMDCRIVDAVTALRDLLDDRKRVIGEANALGVLHPTVQAKLNNSTDLRDGIALCLWDHLAPLLRANISPGALERIIEADSRILDKPIPPGREAPVSPLERFLSKKATIGVAGPATVNRRPGDQIESRMRV